MAETKLLTEFYHLDEYRSLAGYKKHGGYEPLVKGLKMQPQAIIDEVKASGLRGRGSVRRKPRATYRSSTPPFRCGCQPAPTPPR